MVLYALARFEAGYSVGVLWPFHASREAARRDQPVVSRNVGATIAGVVCVDAELDLNTVLQLQPRPHAHRERLLRIPTTHRGPRTEVCHGQRRTVGPVTHRKAIFRCRADFDEDTRLGTQRPLLVA